MNKNLTLLALTLLLASSLHAMTPGLTPEEIEHLVRNHIQDIDEKEDEGILPEDTDTPNMLGKKLLDAIQQRNDMDAVRLIEQKANVNYRNTYNDDLSFFDNKNTHHAIRFLADPDDSETDTDSDSDDEGDDNEPVFRIVIEHNSSDWTPLMLATSRPDTLLLTTKLLEAHAHVNCHATKGCSSLHILLDRTRNWTERLHHDDEAIAHKLIWAGAKLYTSAEKQQLGIASCAHDKTRIKKHDQLRPAILQALQERSTDQLAHYLLMMNPGLLSPQATSQLLLPQSIILLINSFLTNAHFEPRTFASVFSPISHALQAKTKPHKYNLRTTKKPRTSL